MKVKIIITSSGELDRQTINVVDDDTAAKVSATIIESLRAWMLSPGDTIKIIEVD